MMRIEKDVFIYQMILEINFLLHLPTISYIFLFFSDFNQFVLFVICFFLNIYTLDFKGKNRNISIGTLTVQNILYINHK